MIHTKQLAQKEKPDYEDSGHPQIWNFSIFSGMGLDVLEIGVVGGAAGRERSPLLEHYRVLFLTESGRGVVFLCLDFKCLWWDKVQNVKEQGKTCI